MRYVIFRHRPDATSALPSLVRDNRGEPVCYPSLRDAEAAADKRDRLFRRATGLRFTAGWLPAGADWRL